MAGVATRAPAQPHPLSTMLRLAARFRSGTSASGKKKRHSTGSAGGSATRSPSTPSTPHGPPPRLTPPKPKALPAPATEPVENPVRRDEWEREAFWETSVQMGLFPLMEHPDEFRAHAVTVPDAKAPP